MGVKSAAVREHVGAENRHDMPAMLATLAGEDPVRDEVAGALYRGVDDVAARYAQLWKAFPDFTVMPVEILESREACIMLADYTGTHHGDYLGFAPSGRQFAIRIAVVFRFVDGQIASETIYADLAGQLRQLGLLDVSTAAALRGREERPSHTGTATVFDARLGDRSIERMRAAGGFGIARHIGRPIGLPTRTRRPASDGTAARFSRTSRS